MANVLVVDDEIGIRDAFTAFLKGDNHFVDTAIDVENALEKLRRTDFDVVILDILMPRISGLELLKQIKETSDNIQVIMITGGPTIDSASEAVRQSAFDYLIKPIRGHVIRQTVKKAVELKNLTEAKNQLLRENCRYRDHLENLVEERTEKLGKTNDRLRTEISERKQIENELRRTTDTLNGIIASPTELSITAIDSELRVIHCNPAAEKLFEKTRSQVVGQSFQDLLKETPLLPDPLSQIVAQVNDEGKYDFVSEFTASDGGRRFAHIVISPMKGEKDSITGYVIASSDITNRRILEQQLLQSQKLESIGQLAAGIAHEINTPTQYVGDNLNFLKDGFSDLLKILNLCAKLHADPKPEEPSSELSAELVEAIKDVDLEYLREEIPDAISQSLEGIGQVTRIVSAMKEFSHPSLEEMIQTDINSALQSTVTVSRNEWKYVADIDWRLEPSLQSVICLPGELNQVFLNIIVNAAHAIADVVEGGEKGTITIRTRNDGDHVEISIADTGGGIPENIRHRIFDPFFTTKEVGKGTGQGLAIAHNVITAKHRGALCVQSEEGKGSTFIIRLPVSSDSGIAKE